MDQGQHPSAELPQFARALRDAIGSRGIGLQRIADRLRERGTPVSIATLSYWQAGRSEPARESSMAAIAELEDILGLPQQALLSLIGSMPSASARPRGRRVRREDLWPEFRRLDEDLARMSAPGGDRLTKLLTADRFEIGADARDYVHRVHHVVRAEADDVDRVFYVRGIDDEADQLVAQVVTPVRGCTLGRVQANPETGFFVAEMLLSRRLARGETATVEWEATFDQPGRPGTQFSRRYATPVASALIEVRFAHGVQPERCEQFTVLNGVAQRKDLPLDAEGAAHAFVTNFGPGEFGVRWGETAPFGR